jgi:hypothetical protein
MYKIYFIIFFLISLKGFSQTKNPEIRTNSFLFSFKDKSYLISGDSIYSSSRTHEWNGTKHHLEINNYVFFENNYDGYLMHNSGGIIYQFDGIKFDRIDDSYIFNSQYESFPFLYDNNIYNFGGYGLFTYKNIFTYFNLSKKETEIESIKTPLSKHPVGRKKMFSQLEGNELFIGPGLGYNPDIENSYKKSKFIEDYWKFDLIEKEWFKLGDGTPYFKNKTYHLVYHFKNKTLALTEYNIFEIDIKNNNITFYKNSNLDFIKSIKKDRGRYLITYNKSKKGFYAILDKGNAKDKLTFITTNALLGIPNIKEKLYKKDDNSILLFGTGGSILLIIFVFVFLKKTNIQKIKLKRKKIREQLTNEEEQLLFIIEECYPNYIKFPDLMDVFDSHLSYENKKKKLRTALYQIEVKIGKTLKMKSKIFIERKNKEDLRIKEIKIK